MKSSKSLTIKDMFKLLDIKAPVFYNTDLAYEKMSAFSPYSINSYEPGIHIRDLEIHEFSLEFEHFIGGYNQIAQLITNNTGFTGSLTDVVFCCFVIFHEEGHWYDFCHRFKGNADAFIQEYENQMRESNFDITLNKCQNATLPFIRQLHLNSLIKDYRNLDIEKSADNYALEKINQNFTRISEIASNYEPPLKGLWGRPIL